MAISEEAYLFAERYAHFSNVHTIYRDLTSGHYQPSVNMNSDPRDPSADFTMQDVHTTMMFVLYAYFYSSTPTSTVWWRMTRRE